MLTQVELRVLPMMTTYYFQYPFVNFRTLVVVLSLNVPFVTDPPVNFPYSLVVNSYLYELAVAVNSSNLLIAFLIFV